MTLSGRGRRSGSGSGSLPPPVSLSTPPDSAVCFPACHPREIATAHSNRKLRVLLLCSFTLPPTVSASFACCGPTGQRTRTGTTREPMPVPCRVLRALVKRPNVGWIICHPCGQRKRRKIQKVVDPLESPRYSSSRVRRSLTTQPLSVTVRGFMPAHTRARHGQCRRSRLVGWRGWNGYELVTHYGLFLTASQAGTWPASAVRTGARTYRDRVRVQYVGAKPRAVKSSVRGLQEARSPLPCCLVPCLGAFGCFAQSRGGTHDRPLIRQETQRLLDVSRRGRQRDTRAVSRDGVRVRVLQGHGAGVLV